LSPKHSCLGLPFVSSPFILPYHSGHFPNSRAPLTSNLSATVPPNFPLLILGPFFVSLLSGSPIPTGFFFFFQKWLLSPPCTITPFFMISFSWGDHLCMMTGLSPAFAVGSPRLFGKFLSVPIPLKTPPCANIVFPPLRKRFPQTVPFFSFFSSFDAVVPFPPVPLVPRTLLFFLPFQSSCFHFFPSIFRYTVDMSPFAYPRLAFSPPRTFFDHTIVVTSLFLDISFSIWLPFEFS